MLTDGRRYFTIDILRYDITAVENTAGHIFTCRIKLIEHTEISLRDRIVYRVEDRI